MYSTALAIKRRAKRVRNHVVITGTGRAGTTFLVQLLSEMGLDTGADRLKLRYYPHANAGLEYNIRSPDAPYIVKNPELSTQLAGLVENGICHIDHVLLPVRIIRDAAHSRYQVVKNSGQPRLKVLLKQIRGKDPVAGGLWGARTELQQELVLRHKLSELIVALAQHDIPYTLLYFPRLVDDSEYLFSKLKRAFPDISKERFHAAFANVCDVDKVSIR